MMGLVFCACYAFVVRQPSHTCYHSLRLIGLLPAVLTMLLFREPCCSPTPNRPPSLPERILSLSEHLLHCALP
jgi:hypothetical protein